MRKIQTLIIVFALWVISIPSFAQLNVQKYIGAEKYVGLIKTEPLKFAAGRDKNSKEKIEEQIYILRQENTFFLCMDRYESSVKISIGPDAKSFRFCLGNTKSSSIKTLQDMDTICKSYEHEAEVIVTDPKGTNARIICWALTVDNGELFITDPPRKNGQITITLLDSSYKTQHKMISLNNLDIENAIELIRKHQP